MQTGVGNNSDTEALKGHANLNREHLQELLAREDAIFAREHPRSAELFARAQETLLGGVPMN